MQMDDADPRGRSKPTLLLVDDEERILSALRRCLRREGYEILTAESVTRALQVLDERRIDLVLSDHKMPGRSGVDLLREVRRLQPNAGRLLITGWSQAVSESDLEAVGVSAVIAKPWDDAELKQCLRDALSALAR